MNHNKTTLPITNIDLQLRLEQPEDMSTTEKTSDSQKGKRISDGSKIKAALTKTRQILFAKKVFTDVSLVESKLSRVLTLRDLTFLGKLYRVSIPK